LDESERQHARQLLRYLATTQTILSLGSAGIIAFLVHADHAAPILGVLVGAVLGLGLSLRRPVVPVQTAVNLRYAVDRLPDPVQLQEDVIRLRKRWDLIVVSLPFFLAILAFVLITHDTPEFRADADFVGGLVLAALAMILLTKAAECAQVYHALKPMEEHRPWE